MKKTRNLNIALYIRVANKENYLNQYNINHQINTLINYANKHYSNCKYKFYIDNGYSGINYDRPYLKKMIKDISNNEIDIIVCEDISRIGRNPMTVLYSIIKESKIEFAFANNDLKFQPYIFKEILNMYSKILIKDRIKCQAEEIKSKV